ncbi:phosphoribosylaminoimidazolecarboxamide formyltransferase [Clavibacter michiganensis]|uniref:phosphoribosylaminoimidazolecarboxamide formyltransferase n=1 Tax=Clavibacter michiganensis TaxID=28447 RepID=UPI003EBDDEE9
MDMRYGINPHRAPARMTAAGPGGLPFRIVNGEPSYVNVLDAVNAWQLVREASVALGAVVAASFKHVSPAGVARAGALDAVVRADSGLAATEEVDDVTSAYLRARDADPKSSYGDFVAISHAVTRGLAMRLAGMVSDGIIAPGFEDGAVEILRRKKKGAFVVLEADEGFVPPPEESRDVFGVRLTQPADRVVIDRGLLAHADGEALPDHAVDDLLLGMVALRHTQSNSVAYVREGVTLGIGAGQQSRVDCTRLAGAKADTWWLRRLPAVRDMAFRDGVSRQERINWRIRCLEGDMTADEGARLAAALVGRAPDLGVEDRRAWMAGLDGVGFVSDGFLPFRDNIDHARRHGVRYVAEPGGSVRADEVAAACAEHGITRVRTGLRLFHH